MKMDMISSSHLVYQGTRNIKHFSLLLLLCQNKLQCYTLVYLNSVQGQRKKFYKIVISSKDHSSMFFRKSDIVERQGEPRIY
jgi:hypothetical protein